MPPRPRRAVLALTAAAALHLAAAAPPAAAAAAAPAANPDKPSSKRPAPKASKPDTSRPSVVKPDPKQPDPKASKSDPKTSDPSKTDAKKSDPGKTARKTSDPKKPDPSASKSDPKTSDPKKTDPSASKTAPKRSDPKTPDTTPGKIDASKPIQPDPKASKSEPAAPPAPAPVPGVGDGYWLGAELLGPPEAQAAARQALAAGLPAEPGAAGTVGRAATLPEAVQWVARWAFAGDPLPAPSREPADTPLHTGDAPRPGGALRAAHNAILHALTITGRSSDGGTRPIRWPQTSAEIVPPGLPWLPGVLLAERAPLFAAPAPHVAPASERYALVRRSGSLFILGHTDRCTHASGQRVCTRWAQVVARDGDSFRGGYLPAFQVARVDGWIRGAGQNPRAQLLIAGSVGASAQFLLVARTRDGNLHRRTLITPMIGDAYPAARLRVDGDWATIDFAGAPAQRVALDPGMDARVR